MSSKTTAGGSLVPNLEARINSLLASAPQAWVTSDQHFGHKTILKYQADMRGHFPDVHHMNKGLTEQWNDTVGDKDVVLINGDFGWTSPDLYLSKLKGTKVLVMGNHDKVPPKTCIWGRAFKLRYKGHSIWISHYPLWPGTARESVIIQGHWHGTGPKLPRCIDVGWDKHGRILTLDEAIQMALDDSETQQFDLAGHGGQGD